MQRANYVNKLLSIFIVSILLLGCSALLNDQTVIISSQKLKCCDTIDYCTNFQEIAERLFKSYNREDAIAYWCCKIKMAADHQKDSLTTDTCLCRKRLTKLYTEPIGSYDISFLPATRSKYGYFYFSPRNSGDTCWLGGNGKITIDDSCRVIKVELGE
jgi:hypothetical protein